MYKCMHVHATCTMYIYMYMYVRTIEVQAHTCIHENSENHNSLGCEQPSRPMYNVHVHAGHPVLCDLLGCGLHSSPPHSFG